MERERGGDRERPRESESKREEREEREGGDRERPRESKRERERRGDEREREREGEGEREGEREMERESERERGRERRGERREREERGSMRPANVENENLIGRTTGSIFGARFRFKGSLHKFESHKQT